MIKSPWSQSTSVTNESMMERICGTAEEFWYSICIMASLAPEAISKWGPDWKLENQVHCRIFIIIFYLKIAYFGGFWGKFPSLQQFFHSKLAEFLPNIMNVGNM